MHYRRFSWENFAHTWKEPLGISGVLTEIWCFLGSSRDWVGGFAEKPRGLVF